MTDTQARSPETHRERWMSTPLTKLLGIEVPIIQGPLGGFSTERLAAAVSNLGGLGSFGAHGLAPDAIAGVIATIRSLTAKPFAINLWVSMEDPGASASGERDFRHALSTLKPFLDEIGAPLPAYQHYASASFESQARVVLDARPPVFSFIFGIPPREILDECRARKIITIGTATTVDEAIAIEHAGADIVVASGFEAGGHRGSFLRPAEESLTGTFTLVPQIASAVSIPVVAAGGIAYARGVVAALELGADGVQIGTAFLATEESGASALHRNALLSGNVRTGLTKGFTGRLARGIKNRLMDAVNAPDAAILPYPLQRQLVRNLVVPAAKAERADLLQLWSGQNASLLKYRTVDALMRDLVDGVSGILENRAK
jgi:nitronate monooxygenase